MAQLLSGSVEHVAEGLEQRSGRAPPRGDAGLETLPGETCYDHLISGLPLNIFPSALAREILKVYRRLLAPGGILTYFE